MLRGPRLLSWDMVAVMSFLVALGLLPREVFIRFSQTEHASSLYSANWLANSIYSLWIDRNQVKRTGVSSMEYHPLLANLFQYQHLRCRDPRDRIFSMLAISRDAESLAIHTDYSESVHAVYLDASIRILKASKNLQLLTLACRWASDSNQPHSSWALNTPVDPVSATLPFDLCAPHPQTSLPGAPLLRQSSTILVAKGRILQHISTSALPVYPSQSFINGLPDAAHLQSLTQILSGWCKVLRQSQAPLSLRVAASLCRAIMASNPTWSPATHATRSPVEATVFHLWCYFRSLAIVARQLITDFPMYTSNEMALFDSIIQEMAALLSSSIDIDSFDPANDLSPEEETADDIVRAYELFRGRSFAITDQGLLCNSMHEVKQGDAVAALQGTDRLYVLRPVGKQYRLVGDAFIDSVMLGEAYEGLDPDEVDYEIEII